MHTEVEGFSVRYDATRTQYVVARGEVEVVPTASPADPLAWTKARNLAHALNRVYAAQEAEPEFTYGEDEYHFADGSPKPEAREWFEEARARVLRKLRT